MNSLICDANKILCDKKIGSKTGRLYSKETVANSK